MSSQTDEDVWVSFAYCRLFEQAPQLGRSLHDQGFQTTAGQEVKVCQTGEHDGSAGALLSELAEH